MFTSPWSGPSPKRRVFFYFECSWHYFLGDRGSKWIASPGFAKPDLHALSFISTSLYAPILKLGIFLKKISTRLGARKIISNSSEILPIVNYVKIWRQLLLLLCKSNPVNKVLKYQNFESAKFTFFQIKRK